MTTSGRHSFAKDLRWAGRRAIVAATAFSVIALAIGLIRGFDAVASAYGYSVVRMILGYFVAAAVCSVVLAVVRPFLHSRSARIATGAGVGAVAFVAIALTVGPPSNLVLMMGLIGLLMGAYLTYTVVEKAANA